MFGNERNMPVFFTGIDIGYMHFDDGYLDGSHSIANGYGGMGIPSCIQDDAVVIDTYFLGSNFLQFVNNFAFDVTLKIFQVDDGILKTKFFKIGFKRNRTVNLWLSFAQ